MARYQRAGLIAGLLLVTGGLTLTLTGSSLFHSGERPGDYVSPSAIASEHHAGVAAPSSPPGPTEPSSQAPDATAKIPATHAAGKRTSPQPATTPARPKSPGTDGNARHHHRSKGTKKAAPSANPKAPQGSPSHVSVRSASGVEQVDTSLRPAYLDKEDFLVPSPGSAGWYAEPGWPKPGYPGTSILAGHISWSKQPDVFWNLPRVRPGDVVVVTYTSGQKVRFQVTRSSPERKTSVPHDRSIWDAGNPKPLLRLITCDPDTSFVNHHYLGNWVVWARPL